MSRDGYTSACVVCMRASKRKSYWERPGERFATIDRMVLAKKARFETEPGYRRAFVLWGSTKRRTTIPRCMKITDFVPICRKAEAKGTEYVLDHVVPLRHPEVCGLHVPWNLRVVKKGTNRRKGSTFRTDWPK